MVIAVQVKDYHLILNNKEYIIKHTLKHHVKIILINYLLRIHHMNNYKF